MRKSGRSHGLRPTLAIVFTAAAALLLAGFKSCPGKQTSGIAHGPKAEALLSPARRQILDGLKKQSTQPVNIVVDTRTKSVLYLGMTYPIGATPESPDFADKANGVMQTILSLLDTQVSAPEIVPDNSGCDQSVQVYDRSVGGIKVLGSTVTLQFSSAGELTSVVNAVASVSSQVKGPTRPPSTVQTTGRSARLSPASFSEKTATVGTLSSSPGSPILPGNNYDALLPVVSNGSGYLQQVTVQGQIQQTAGGGTKIAANLVTIDGRTVSTVGFTQPTLQEALPLYHVEHENGVPDYISYRRVGGAVVESLPGDNNAADIVYRFLTEHPSVFHTGSPRCQFTTQDIGSSSGLSGVQFVRMEQRYAGLPVFGAQLVFEVHDQNKVMSVAGHVLPDIFLDITPQVTAVTAAGNARSAALNALAQSTGLKQSYINSVTQSLQTGPSKAQLGIFPGSIVPQRRLTDRLAYKISIADFVYFIDAQSGVVLYSYSTKPSETILYDGLAKSDSSTAGYVEAVIGTVPTGAIALNTDLAGGMPVSLAKVAGEYEQIGWSGSDNHGADWIANSNVAISSGCPNSEYQDSLNQTFYCLGFGILPDVVGHENTHGVINYSSNLVYQDESGAMNESYADLFGELLFHDATAAGAASSWLVAESPTGAAPLFGALRDMANPATFGVALVSGALTVGCLPGVAGLVCDPPTYGAYVARNTPGSGCNLLPTSCDNGFVHTNSGILNRAHAMMTGLPGGTTPAPPFPGLSGGDPNNDTMARNKLKYLAFLVMTFKLTPWARMMDAAFLTQDAANILVARGASDIEGDAYTQADADQVPLAFGMVGLSPVLSTGWAEPSLGFVGTDAYTPANPGGCLITNVVANLYTPSGVLQADLSPATAIPPLVAWPGAPLSTLPSVGGIAFFPPPVTGVASAPIGTVTGTYSITWFNIFGHKPGYDTTLVTAPPPAGANDCITAVGSTPVIRFSAVGEHSEFAVGGKGVDTAGNATSAMSAGCTVTSTLVQMVDKGGNLMEGPAPSVRHVYSSNVFFSITSGAVITGALPAGPPNLSTTVRWWFDSGVAIRYQLVYFISQPNGTTCTP